MSGARYVVTLLGFAAVGLTVASLSLVSQGWWQANYTTGGTASSLYIGPLKTCQGSICDWNSYGSVTYSSCTRNGSDISARIWSVFCLAILAGLCGFLGGGMGAIAKKSAVKAASATTFFGGICGAVSMGLFYQTIEKWLFCGDSFCSLSTTNTSCSTIVNTIPYLLMGFATILLFVAGLTGAGVAYSMASDEPAPPTDAEAPPPTAGPLPAAATSSNDANGTGEAQPAQPDKAVTDTTTAAADHDGKPHDDQSRAVGDGDAPDEAAPAADAGGGEGDDEGDWTWDEDAQMYWSDSSQLYLDWDSGWYYDPYSCYWYDPETGEWVYAYAEAKDSTSAEAAA